MTDARRLDAIVVGARCAGAALAQRLAADGLSVALLDAANLPSDQPSSTHLIQPPGMDELDALGLGDAVRGRSPALEAVRLSFDGNEARLPYGDGRAAHCLRREALDTLLQESAAAAGAELQPRSRVVGLVQDGDGRVRGVEVRHGQGPTERLHADVVVGADGRNSTVAKLAGAGEYRGYDGPRAAYWAYWPRPPAWDAHEVYNSFAGTDAHIAFPTGDDQLLIATVPPVPRALAWRGEHAAAYLADVRAHPRIGPVLGDRTPVGRVRGVLRPRYFFRESAGPGWALVGDAGHHKEFVVGLGITDALRDARGLAGALLAKEPGAVERWWRRRDVERIEIFGWSRELGRAEAVNALERALPGGLAGTPELSRRLGEIIDGRRSPYDLVPSREALRWAGAALMRGELGIVQPLAAGAARRIRARRDLRECRRIASSGPGPGRARAAAPSPRPRSAAVR